MAGPLAVWAAKKAVSEIRKRGLDMKEKSVAPPPPQMNRTQHFNHGATEHFGSPPPAPTVAALYDAEPPPNSGKRYF